MAELALLLGDVVIHRFPLDEPEILIGRSPDSDILITDASVSARHAILHCEIDSRGDLKSVVLEDLDSTNGSLVNNQFVRRQELLHNDVVTVGSTHLKVIDENAGDEHTVMRDTGLASLREKLEHADLDGLSARERHVFDRIGQGKQRKEIARELNLSVHTVADHVKSVYRKLGISSKHEAVLLYNHLNG